MEQNIKDYTTEISIKNLQNGIYLVKVESGSDTEIIKFVKTE